MLGIKLTFKLFLLVTVVILSFYGGFATVRAYLKDMFGTLVCRASTTPGFSRISCIEQSAISKNEKLTAEC